MFENIKGFLWEEWNIEHIERHGIVPDEVEEAFYHDQNRKFFNDDLHSEEGEKRYFGLAKVPSSGRLLKFVFVIEDEYLVIITAYQCTNDKKLVEAYNQSN